MNGVQEYAEEVVGYDATAYAQPGMEFAQPGAAGAVMDAPQVPISSLCLIALKHTRNVSACFISIQVRAGWFGQRTTFRLGRFTVIHTLFTARGADASVQGVRCTFVPSAYSSLFARMVAV